MIKKTISFIVALSFVFSNIVFADAPKNTTPDAKKQVEITTDPEKIIVPRDYGLIKSRYTAKDSNKLVVHIQDAHCNYEAQSNIIKILECLIKNDGLGLISVEGADGFIDTSWFKAFPDADIRKEVADYFMKKGEITGPEFLSITSDYPIKLFGAETRSYYIENLNAFTSSYPLKEDTEKYFNQIKTVINKLKSYIYSEELKEFDAKTQDYESKKLSFTDYVKYLESLGEKHKVALRQYGNLFKLASVLIYEKKINFTVVDKERATLIDIITKKLDKEQLTDLVNKSLEFKVGKIASVQYYDYLKALAVKHGVSIAADYPNLFNYIIYNSVYSRIENEQLFNDIKKFEEAVKEKMFANDDQRTLERLSRHVNTLLGLVNIKLLNGDFDYYKAHKEEFEYEAFSSFINKMTTRYGFAYEIDAPSEAVRESMPKLEDFYAIAIKRDKALVDNTIDAMNKEKARISVLVTGGFHSEGIAKLLEKQGVSYIVVCPNITKDVETPYIKILTNQRTPLEEILSDTGAATTTDAKNVKGSMLAPYLITAALSNGAINEEFGNIRLKDDLKEWARKNIELWLPQVNADIENKRLSFTPEIVYTYFKIAVDNSVDENYKENSEKITTTAKMQLIKNANMVKNMALPIITELLKMKYDIGAIRMNGGKLTAAEHGYGASEADIERANDIENEASVNGVIASLINAGEAHSIHPYTVKVNGDRTISHAWQAPTLGIARENFYGLLVGTYIFKNMILITGLKEELKRRNVAPDLIFHPGITRKAIYIDEDDFKYLLSLPDGADIIVEAIEHERKHIANPRMSEAEIEKIAPTIKVRAALAMRDMGVEGKGIEMVSISAQELAIKRVFGTNGIRSDDMGIDAQRRIASGAAQILKAQWQKANPDKELPYLMVGFDPRPQGVNGFNLGQMGESKAVAEVLVAYGFKVLFVPKAVAAPFMISMTGKGVHPKNVYASVMRTASHNEVVDQKTGRLVSGVKLFIDNAPASDAVTGLISERINNASLAQMAPRIGFDKAVVNGSIVIVHDGDENDPNTIEFNRLSRVFDLSKLGEMFRKRYPDLKIAINTMNGGMSAFALRAFKAMGFKEGTDFKAFNTTLMNDPSMEAKMTGWVEYTDPVTNQPKKVRFAPDPTRPWMRGKDYADYVASDPMHIIALLIDGDADRLVAELKKEIIPNDIGMLAAYYLAKYKGQTGRIVRTVPTTGGLDALSKALGMGEVQVTPVGSKWFAGPNKYYDGTLNDILVVIEESGHIGFIKQDRISGKRELFFDHSIGLALLMLEMMVDTGKTWEELSDEMWAFIKGKTGQDKIAAVRYGISKDEGAEKYYDLVARLGNPKEDAFRKEFGSKLEIELKASGLPWKVKSFDITDSGGAQFKFTGGQRLFPRKSGTDGSVRLYIEVLETEREKAPELVKIMRSVMDYFITQKPIAAAMNNIDVDVTQAAKALGMGEALVRQAIVASVNKTMLLNDFAESVGIKKDIALENMERAGLAVITNKDKSEYELAHDFFVPEKLKKYMELQVAASSNPAMVDLTLVRIQRIILNAVKADVFISKLSQSMNKTAEVIADVLKKNNAFSTLVATWRLADVSKTAATGQTVALKVEDMVKPQSAAFYQSKGVQVEFTLPADTKVNPQVLQVFKEYQNAMAGDMARGQYNYRGTGTRQTVEQFFNDYFMKEWYGKIRDFVNARFGKDRPLKAIVTNGIGANDQFMWSLVRMYNENRPAGAPKWYHATTARDLSGLLRDGVADENTLWIDISRSGGTWEGVEAAIRSLGLNFSNRIAIANGGPLKAIALEAARWGGYEPLIIGMSPDIGGRNMHRKTTIYYTAQTVAGMFLPSMDSAKFALLNHEFDKANDFADADKSLPLSTGKFLHGAMKLLGVEHIALITNTEPLRLAGTEWEQYIMEGSNKEDVISMGIHDLTKEPEHVLRNLKNSPAGKLVIGMVLLDKSAPDYNQDIARVNTLKDRMPLMVFTIDSAKALQEGFKGGISPTQQAAFDILWTDMITTFTTLLRVDANSNPNVALVRKYTADRVAKWKDAEIAYSNDAIAKEGAEVLISYGSPAESKIGSEGKQIAMTLGNASAKGQDLARELVNKGLLNKRNRLNLFVGRDDLLDLVKALRNDTYGSDLTIEAGWIAQTALFPLWSHKGLEANLAFSADPDRLLLANKTLNIFLNARKAGSDDILNQKFDDLGITVNGKKIYEGVNGATIHQTNDAMTIPNIKRMAELSPTILFEFDDKTPNVESIIKAFYGAFIEELGKELAPATPVTAVSSEVVITDKFDHTIAAIIQSSDTGERARKTAENMFKVEKAKISVKKHLVFVKSAIPSEQLATTTAINYANYCADYYNQLEGYTADVVDNYEKAIELLAKNPGWDKTNTIVGLIDKQALDKMTAQLKKNNMKDKTKLLPMETFDKGQFVPLKGFFDLMSVLVSVNRPLDRLEDQELRDLIKNLLNEIGVRDVNSLVDALSVAENFEDPMKFAKNFIIRLLPPTKANNTAELREKYNAAKKVIESL